MPGSLKGVLQSELDKLHARLCAAEHKIIPRSGSHYKHKGGGKKTGASKSPPRKHHSSHATSGGMARRGARGGEGSSAFVSLPSPSSAPSLSPQRDKAARLGALLLASEAASYGTRFSDFSAQLQKNELRRLLNGAAPCRCNMGAVLSRGSHMAPPRFQRGGGSSAADGADPNTTLLVARCGVGAKRQRDGGSGGGNNNGGSNNGISAGEQGAEQGGAEHRAVALERQLERLWRARFAAAPPSAAVYEAGLLSATGTVTEVEGAANIARANRTAIVTVSAAAALSVAAADCAALPAAANSAAGADVTAAVVAAQQQLASGPASAALGFIVSTVTPKRPDPRKAAEAAAAAAMVPYVPSQRRKHSGGGGKSGVGGGMVASAIALGDGNSDTCGAGGLVGDNAVGGRCDVTATGDGADAASPPPAETVAVAAAEEEGSEAMEMEEVQQPQQPPGEVLLAVCAQEAAAAPTSAWLANKRPRFIASSRGSGCSGGGSVPFDRSLPHADADANAADSASCRAPEPAAAAEVAAVGFPGTLGTATSAGLGGFVEAQGVGVGAGAGAGGDAFNLDAFFADTNGDEGASGGWLAPVPAHDEVPLPPAL